MPALLGHDPWGRRSAWDEKFTAGSENARLIVSVVAIPMGIDLGPKLHNNAEVSRRISQAISEIYGVNPYIRFGYIAVIGIVVFWRAWIVAGRSIERTILHGAIIGTVAAILVAVQMASYGVGIKMLVPVVVSIVAGAFGGMKRASCNTGS